MRVETIKNIVSTNMVRYKNLANLMPLVYADSDADNINIFIDLYPIYRSLFSINSSVVIEDKMDLIAGIINLCAHYRWFFFNSYGVESTIYLVSGLNCSKINNQLFPNYNRGTMIRFTGDHANIMKDILKNTINTLSIICPYLNDIHFVKTSYETSVAILGIINYLGERGRRVPNLVISKDVYPLQLPLIDSNITYLRPKKNFNGDISFIVKSPDRQITNEMFWNAFYMDRNLNNPRYDISPYNMILLLALSGLRQRSIPGLVNITKATNMISEIIGDKPIICPVNTLYENNKKYMDKKNITIDIINARYHALDAKFLYEAFYASSVEPQTYLFENKFDPQALMMINSKYFENNPLDLARL